MYGRGCQHHGHGHGHVHPSIYSITIIILFTSRHIMRLVHTMVTLAMARGHHCIIHPRQARTSPVLGHGVSRAMMLHINRPGEYSRNIIASSSSSSSSSSQEQEPTKPSQQQGESVDSDSSPPPRRPPRLPVQGMKLERVERLNQDAWAGVANVDRGSTTIGLKDIAIVAGGDIASLMIFATIGRVSHGEALSLMDSFGTALPFIIGFTGASILSGGYGTSAITSPITTAARSWVTGIPAGLVIRTIIRGGHVPEATFILISMAVTGVFVIGWRSVFARFLATPLDSSLSKADQLQKRQNKRGNPFEFISLLVSLVKRW